MSSRFTEQIDVIELLNTIIGEHEDRAASLINQIENINYAKNHASPSPHEKVTPGHSPSDHVVHAQGSRRDGGTQNAI